MQGEDSRRGEVPAGGPQDYEPPAVRILGTLEQLTGGGSTGTTDGVGLSGASGIV